MPAKVRFNSLRVIDQKYGGILRNIDPKAKDKAFQAYQEVGRVLEQRSGRGFRHQSIMNQETSKIIQRVVPDHIGKLVAFAYEAKWKDKLPYWDYQPLIIPLGPKPGGFLGMNFHYLHPFARAVLMDFLLNNSRYGWMTDNYQQNMQYANFKKRRIQMAYEDLQAICATPIYKPCIKHYLYPQKRGNGFYLVDPCDWFKFLWLPTEDFKTMRQQGATTVRESYDKTKVWADSMAGGPGKRGRRT